MESSSLGSDFRSLSLWKACQSCGRPSFYPSSPGYPRQVQASPSQWAASSNRHVLRLILAFLPFWVLPSQGAEQWLLCFQCGTMWGSSNEWWFLPGSSKTSLPLMEVGPGEEMLGHWRSGEARLGLWGPASKWITCLSLVAPHTDLCQWNSPETETSELELVGLRGVIQASGQNICTYYPDQLFIFSWKKLTCQGYLNIRGGSAVSGLARDGRMSESRWPIFSRPQGSSKICIWGESLPGPILLGKASLQYFLSHRRCISF